MKNVAAIKLHACIALLFYCIELAGDNPKSPHVASYKKKNLPDVYAAIFSLACHP